MIHGCKLAVAFRTRSIDSPKTRGHAQDGWKPANSARSRPLVRYSRRLSWPGWLTYSWRLTHEVVTRQPTIRRRLGKVRRLQTDVLTTEPRRQRNPVYICCFTGNEIFCVSKAWSLSYLLHSLLNKVNIILNYDTDDHSVLAFDYSFTSFLFF